MGVKRVAAWRNTAWRGLAVAAIVCGAAVALSLLAQGLVTVALAAVELAGLLFAAITLAFPGLPVALGTFPFAFTFSPVVTVAVSLPAIVPVTSTVVDNGWGRRMRGVHRRGVVVDVTRLLINTVRSGFVVRVTLHRGAAGHRGAQDRGRNKAGKCVCHGGQTLAGSGRSTLLVKSPKSTPAGCYKFRRLAR